MPHDHEITGKRKKHEVRIPDVFFFLFNSYSSSID